MNLTERLIELGNEIPDVTELGAAEFIGEHKGKIIAGVAGAGAVTAAGVGMHRHFKKQKEWAAQAGPNDFLEIGHDVYIDKHGAMLPGNHPRLKQGRVVKLSASTPDVIELGLGGIPSAEVFAKRAAARATGLTLLPTEKEKTAQALKDILAKKKKFPNRGTGAPQTNVLGNMAKSFSGGYTGLI